MRGTNTKQRIGPDEGSGVWRTPWRNHAAIFVGSKSGGFSELLEDLELNDQLEPSERPLPMKRIEGCELERSERPTLPDGPACGFGSPIRVGPAALSDSEIVAVRRSA